MEFIDKLLREATTESSSQDVNNAEDDVQVCKLEYCCNAAYGPIISTILDYLIYY